MFAPENLAAAVFLVHVLHLIHLVHDLQAQERLHDILHGHHPVGSPVFVHHQGQVVFAFVSQLNESGMGMKGGTVRIGRQMFRKGSCWLPFTNSDSTST